jgi:hypothetical protein
MRQRHGATLLLALSILPLAGCMGSAPCKPPQTITPAQSIVHVPDSTATSACLALLEERRGLVEPDRRLLIQEAWTRYHLRQRLVAHRMFTQLDRIYSTRETRQGLRVVEAALNRVGS